MFETMEKKPLSRLRQAVAKNVQALIDRDFPQRRGQISRFCEKHPKIRLSKVQRAIKDGGVNLETVEQLAGAFGLAGYQLLIEKLNVKDPQIAIERAYWKKAQELAKEISGRSE